ncbi:hypothetical protein phiA047_0112 [Aeromonas phage phiA047]|nr:hypothetical protein phiA047_0112 [Aeromonas phage phiA047]
MAQPTNPLIVWASDDVILPNAQRPNKSLPSESLIQTGWDLSQKPAADEWNYLLNNNGQYIKWLIEEKINEFLKKSENLNDLANKATARTNLDVFSKSEVNNKNILSGAGLTGGGDLSIDRTISMSTPSTVGAGSSNSTVSGASSTHSHALDVTGNVAVLTGTIAHGGTIPLPSGYTEAQCKWSVSTNSQVTALSTDGSDDRAYIRCFTTGRVVSCYMSNKDAPEVVKESGVANYIIIGVK